MVRLLLMIMKIFILFNIAVIPMVKCLTESEQTFAIAQNHLWRTSSRGGYHRAHDLLNCSTINSLDPLEKQIINRHWFPERKQPAMNDCFTHHLVAMCSARGDFTSFFPHSHLCDYDMKEWEMGESGSYRLCMRPDVLNSSSPSCRIISIGSNNHWGFELGAYKYTKCQTHTFDPRAKDNHMKKEIVPPGHIKDRTFFHQFMLLQEMRSKNISKKEKIKYRDKKDWLEILELSNVSSTESLSILKIDCEGCEKKLFRNLLNNGLAHTLPPIIVLELHIMKLWNFVESRWTDLNKTSSLDILGTNNLDTIAALIESGYTMFDTRIGDGGCEMGFLRIKD